MCQALAQAWETLRMGQSSLPVPEDVIILPLTEQRGRPSALGHFGRSRWIRRPGGVHEIAVHPGLFHKPEDLLLVLLHEAAHTLLMDSGGGCSGDGYYHLKAYRNQCFSMGLRCDFTNTRHGWNHTRWPEQRIPACYSDAFEVLKGQLKLAAASVVQVSVHDGNPLPKSGRLPLKCGCSRPRSIYVARGVALVGGVRCDFCGQEFTLVEE